jgi:tetratricopeptide (TPR) repeat protein
MRARRLSAVVLAFVLALAVFSATRGDERAAAGPPAVGGTDVRPSADTDTRIARLQADVRNGRTDRVVDLADAYLQKVRETGDASFYTRADRLLRSALARDPRDVDTLVESAALAAGRHDFRGALALGRRAQAAQPGTLAPLPIVVDALVELGRYGAAERTLQRLVDLKPNLTAYARVSYFRELHGDLDGAVAAMRLAVSAGSGTPENAAYVQALLGDLEFARGRLTAAGRAYREALALVPRYAPAGAGLARVEAARGDLGGAIRRLRGVVARLPLPQYVVALGDTELAAGRAAAARRDLALVRVEERLLARAGVNTDVDLALFEADHGDPARAVTLARRSWAAAPSVRSADALGWALTRSGDPRAGVRWARRALRLGSRDAMFLFHAGIAARAAGERGLARHWLTRALADNPRFSPLYAPRAARALEELGR